jgi:hypothetical protein
LALAVALKTDKYGALGRLHCFWYWCLAYAPDGDLRKFDSETICLSCSIPLNTLVQCGFVDTRPFVHVHDWWDYAGRYLKIKFKDYPDKWKRIERTVKGRVKGGIKPPNQPNQPDLTNQPTSIKVSEWFNKIWLAYPKDRRHGKEVAFARFSKSVVDLETARRCARALENYLKNLNDQKYLMRASRWFGEWEDHADDKPRDSERVLGSHATERPAEDYPSEGARKQAAIAHDVLRATADSKAFGNAAPPDDATTPGD